MEQMSFEALNLLDYYEIEVLYWVGWPSPWFRWFFMSEFFRESGAYGTRLK